MPTTMQNPADMDSPLFSAGENYRDRSYTFSVAVPGQEEFEVTVRMPSRTAMARAATAVSETIIDGPVAVSVSGLEFSSSNAERLAELDLATSVIVVNNGGISRWSAQDRDDLTSVVIAAIISGTDPGAAITARLILSSQSSLGVVDDYSIFQAMYREVGETLDGDDPHQHPAYFEEGFSNSFHLVGVSDPRGRSFGLEIEVDFPDSSDWGSERNDLAYRMGEAGLSRHHRPLGWHYAARGGERYGEPSYSDDLSTWTVEADSSVDGVGGARGCEIVSPILYNTPESWEAVKKVIDLVNELGGKVTSRTGLHVNIGASDFDQEMTKAAALTNLTRRFDDVLVRVGHSPEIGNSHRGRHYCHTPAVSVGRRFDPFSLMSGNGHHSAVNLTHIPAPGSRPRNSSRVEFRFFDGTLDMGRLQMNVELCMAFMAYSVTAPDPRRYTEYVVGGHHHGQRGGRPARRLTGAEFRESTLEIRTFLDDLQVDEILAKKIILAYRTSRWQQA